MATVSGSRPAERKGKQDCIRKLLPKYSLGFYKEKVLPYENKEKSGLLSSIFYLRKRRTPDRGESGPGQPDWESFCSDPRCPARNIYTEDCSFKI